MLDIIVENFNKKFAFEPQQEAVKLFEKARMTESSIKKVLSSDENSFLKLPRGVMDKVIFSLNNRVFENFDKYVVLNLVDYDEERFLDKPFKYDNNLKALFIRDMAKIRTSKVTTQPFRKNFEDIEILETKFEKSVLDFNKEDIVNTLQYFRSENINYMTYRMAIKNISRFVDFAKKGFNEWTEIRIAPDWKYDEIINIVPASERPSHLLSYESLMEIAYGEDSIQNAIIPILLFEGVKSARDSSKSELTNLKEDDIIGNKIYIQGENSRVIELTDEEAQFMETAKNTNEIFKANRGGSGRFIQLYKTGYLIRSSGEYKLSPVLSDPAIQKRMRTIRSDFENIIGDNEFTVTSVRTSGMVHNIDKLLANGLPINKAVYQTLIKFGDINEKDIEGTNGNLAMQKAHRLKSTYLLHKGKK